MRALVRVAGAVRMQPVQVGAHRVFTGLEEARHARGVGFADGFAVPASALGVDLSKHLLVGLAGPLEGVGELVLVDLVVMIDEDVTMPDGVVAVPHGAELVSVPGQVDVQGWDGHVGGVLLHDLKEVLVLFDQSLHSAGYSWRVQPINVVHLLNKNILANDGTNEIQRKDG